jgi:hypothetical protein
MTLTESNSPGPAFDPARPTKTFDDSPIPYDALARLPALHGEAGRNLHLSQFLARSPQASIALMLAGAVTLVWAGGTLKADFAWATLVLIGVVGMTRNYIRGFARSLRRVPLQEAASDLRLLLLYTGAVWGAGAFLVMPDLPVPALVFLFAASPSLALALILKDDKGVIAFVAPAAAASASAAMLGAWPLDVWVAGAVLATAVVIVCLPMLQWPYVRAVQRRRKWRFRRSDRDVSFTFPL